VIGLQITSIVLLCIAIALQVVLLVWQLVERRPNLFDIEEE